MFIFIVFVLLTMFLEAALIAAQNSVDSLGLLLGLIVLVLIGSVIIWVVGALIFFLPAAVIAGVVWYMTGNSDYAGIAFLLVALLSISKRR